MTVIYCFFCRITTFSAERVSKSMELHERRKYLIKSD